MTIDISIWTCMSSPNSKGNNNKNVLCDFKASYIKCIVSFTNVSSIKILSFSESVYCNNYSRRTSIKQHWFNVPHNPLKKVLCLFTWSSIVGMSCIGWGVSTIHVWRINSDRRRENNILARKERTNLQCYALIQWCHELHRSRWRTCRQWHIARWPSSPDRTTWQCLVSEVTSN